MNSLFGLKHIILIVVSIALIVGLYLGARKLKFETVCKSLFYVGIVSEIVKIFYYIIANEAKYGGVLPKTDLPFHLCSIQIIFIMIVNFTKNEKLKKILLSFMLPSCLFGGIAAILIPTGTALNSWVITVQYFLYHIAIVVFSLYLFTSKDFKKEFKNYVYCLEFLLGLMFFSIYINSVLYDGVSNINFMYVVSPPQSGLPYLNEDKGWLVYILRYALLIIVCVSACYIKPIVQTIKAKWFNKGSIVEQTEEKQETETEAETKKE
ncbi:MAG: YwaF family protein [Clostridia bacterium]|nr:YwaF family protein [Clostridia bacterium]